MAKEIKPTPADLSLRPLGHARENKDASAYTGFKYPPGGGNDIGVYKQPMENPNAALAKQVTERDFVNKKTAYEITVKDPGMTVSIGYDDQINARGVGEMRGYGAAIKGRKISGKMG